MLDREQVSKSVKITQTLKTKGKKTLKRSINWLRLNTPVCMTINDSETYQIASVDESGSITTCKQTVEKLGQVPKAEGTKNSPDENRWGSEGSGQHATADPNITVGHKHQITAPPKPNHIKEQKVNLKRDTNVLFSKLPESTAQAPYERLEHDVKLVTTEISKLIGESDRVSVRQIIRLGKSRPGS